MNDWPELTPLDEHNRTLSGNVAPKDWVNPEPSGRYNLVVIGAGSAGLITSAIAAGLGAKVALVEGHHLGGDCLNVGCIPSKGVIRASRMVAEARRAANELGLPLADDAAPDFGRVMQRMRRIRAQISSEDSATRYRDELGVDVYLGQARFRDSGTLEVGGRKLHFKRAVIATGARAARPQIPGLDETGYRTNESIFNLTEKPRRLGVIGAGPIGCELAQAFRRLGCEVALLHADRHILPREDADAAAVLSQRFAAEGVRVVDACEIRATERRPDGRAIRFRHPDGLEEDLVVDEILVAVGRAPNVAGLGLEAAGVTFDTRRGVHVDDHLRTANRRIFAAGDVCMNWKFTHAADTAAKIVVRNALFFPIAKLSSQVMPWCTYTDPEIAHVGLYAHEAHERGIEVDTFQVPLAEVNRAVTDGEDEGFVKIHTERGKDRIRGATIVASHAGEMLSELTLAMVHGVGLDKLFDVIHPYPTQAEGIKRAAGARLRTRLTPLAAGALRRWLAIRR
ncbi:MAG: mercuric reductase [Myxococcota bacterium]|jgi:pyruvate/2-oxoglutarate dehydrogenase complex dihydrolipoamide dehydrogenase (E3) component|nr:mercuric reductase [Deltaproteobacteria bacterium]MCP4241807.1 mercuric reductase [bacterium]MDP6074156.1 mercuric reductase [Myxococcota bacterium]MDP6241773.1 mercuric reductase [Myxococcota bacterium]MDP7074591.1 mercuric reductase [Myxococcota bacterium]